MTIEPAFKWIRRSRTTTFVGETAIGAPRGMGFDLIGLAILQIDPASIGFVTRNSRREAFVHVSQPLVIALPILILNGVRIWIAKMPELADKVLALIICF